MRTTRQTYPTTEPLTHPQAHSHVHSPNTHDHATAAPSPPAEQYPAPPRPCPHHQHRAYSARPIPSPVPPALTLPGDPTLKVPSAPALIGVSSLSGGRDAPCNDATQCLKYARLPHLLTAPQVARAWSTPGATHIAVCTSDGSFARFAKAAGGVQSGVGRGTCT